MLWIPISSWNKGLIKENIDRVITRTDLSYMMGWEKHKVLDHLFPDYDVEIQEKIFNTVNEIQTELIPEMGVFYMKELKRGWQTYLKSINYL